MQDYITRHVVKSFGRKVQRWRDFIDDGQNYADPKFYPSSFQIFTWNVNFNELHAVERLHTILKYIARKIPKRKDGVKPVPCCILLQEVAREVFPALLEHAWVRAHFQMIPTTPNEWPVGAAYGVVTLVARSLWVHQAQSLVFGTSCMVRSALFVDIRMNIESLRVNGDRVQTSGAEPDPEVVILRLANTHLESLPGGAAARVVQLNATAALLREVDCGVVCGDMNAIGYSDINLHVYAGLKDAWKRAEGPAGYTWGYQPVCQFPVGRLDKILYTPSDTLEVEELKRVGVGLKTPEGYWASDHFGLRTVVRVV
ncbi:hypothetical protein EUX98_g971 [Antrodiella citrinella]|uniref:Endonuclease/exonuclease/phosphatase domain-containing protein n=1 Tax=Antrodiella citrinella TaxID=2447956 RepID=A0A4S4N474_9APHY|nr:hypothetical protein EUX98_g971 [Antrodiella citrinella]